MTPERFRQIRKIYEAALEVDPTERQAFVVQACQGEDDLAREVEVLLGAREHSSEFIAGPALGTEYQSYDARRECVRSLVGRRIGVYEITREIGRGGMGTVYLASRADGIAHKRVAVKIVRADLAGSELA